MTLLGDIQRRVTRSTITCGYKQEEVSKICTYRKSKRGTISIRCSICFIYLSVRLPIIMVPCTGRRSYLLNEWAAVGCSAIPRQPVARVR